MRTSRPRTWLTRAALLLTLVSLAACEMPSLPGSYLLTPPSAQGQAQTLTPSITPEPTTAAPEATELTDPNAELPPTETLQPTETLSPTVTDDSTATITPTWDGTPSRTPTRTQLPTRTRRPTRTPTITPTPTPPLAWMRIDRPGPYSKVSSPFHVEAVITPGDDGLVHAELIGEDGRVILRQDLDYSDMDDRHLVIGPDIDFSILATSETARLVLYTLDQFERIIYLVSVDVVLMKVGDDELVINAPQMEPFIIRRPRDEAEVSGGMLQFEGLARLLNDKPLIIEVTDEQGNLLGNTEAVISQPYGNLSHIPFTALIPYSVTEPTGVRVTFRQESTGRIPGTIWLSSMTLTLLP